MRHRTTIPLSEKVVFVIQNIQDMNMFFNRDNYHYRDPVVRRLADKARALFGFSYSTTAQDIVRGFTKAYARVQKANAIHVDKAELYDERF
jgi:hypothetical protein